ncbi:hypothetical protein CYLTODRAFT_444700 [Cylindrobasidium torrendii FP15055 ss-10]|uniref:Mid2 domain-containing protein n=1 Tax=Cylindrobasidium torrendii FP15055 ss-10 TaxID=1314674 RepID=A0A0D7B868_9AGAR|nr:hypothetical protein CYLTODRAFT_444700 [Cylindrobasidium torrendii FP15055 ss-10]
MKVATIVTAVFALLLGQLFVVQGQESVQPECTDPDFAWTFNRFHQSPCEVATTLGKACDSDYNIVLTVRKNWLYGLNNTNAAECLCNTMYYNLFSACGRCVAASHFYSWSNWQNENSCESVTASFPQTHGPGTDIPYWASLPLKDGIWDRIAARAAVSGSSTEPSSSTSTTVSTESTSSTSADPSQPSVPGSTHPSSPHSSSESTHPSHRVGVIIGSACAGVVALLASIIVFIVLYRRRIKNRADQGPNLSDTTCEGGSAAYTSIYTNQAIVQSTPFILYNPDDFSNVPECGVGRGCYVGGYHSG